MMAGVSAARLRAAFWSVMASFLVHGLVVSTWVSRIHSVKSELRLSDGALGMSLLGTAIGSMIAIPICGTFVARRGSRRTVAWTGLGFCGALLLPGLAQNSIELFVALLAYGAMAGANDVAMNAQAVATERTLGVPAMSRFHGMFSLGGIAGAAAGGYMAFRGMAPFTHLAGAAAVIAAIAVTAPRFMLDGGVHESAPPATRRQRIPVLLAALSAIGFCVFLSEGAIADWAGVYLHQVLRSSDAFGAAGYAVFSSAMAVFRFCGDTITRRIGRVRVIRYGGIIAAAGLAAAVVAPSPWWAIVGFGCAGAGFSSIVPNVFAAAGRVSSVREGTAVATVSGLGYLGFLVGPPAIGFTSELFSLRGGLCLLVILSAAAAMLASVVQRGGSAPACDARQEGALCRSAAPPHTLSNA